MSNRRALRKTRAKERGRPGSRERAATRPRDRPVTRPSGSPRAILSEVDAQPLLARIARALAKAKLEAVLIGNAAAALQGAPVTTLDFDFFFRDTPANRKKLVVFARELGAIVLRPYDPASSLFRVTDDDLVLQADFLGAIHGLRSFEGVKRRASTVDIGGQSLRVACLEDIVKSKRAANRPKDRAVLPVLEATLDAKRREE